MNAFDICVVNIMLLLGYADNGTERHNDSITVLNSTAIGK